MKILNIIEQRDGQDDLHYSFFVLRKISHDQAEDKIREIVRKYIDTKDGQETVKDLEGNFTWSDALQFVPDELFLEAGFAPIPEDDTIEVFVNAEENVFYADEEEETE